MNALTIEQLKSLEVGEWVYLTNADRMYGTYVKKLSTSDDEGFAWENIETLEKYKYNEYSIDWLVFRNKQEAEARGEIVELPCNVGGDTVYVIMEIEYKYKIVEYSAKNIIVDEHRQFYFDTPTSYSHRLKFGQSVFADKSEAERRLAELTKGKDITSSPFKASEGQPTCNTCKQYEDCVRRNGSKEHIDGCRTCKCYEKQLAEVTGE